MNITIEKIWDENERVTEYGNRTYVSTRGRWQWILIVNGETLDSFDTRREARERAEQLAITR